MNIQFGIVNTDKENPLELKLVKEENSRLSFKTLYNNIKVDLSLYDFDKAFLETLYLAIGDYLYGKVR